MVAALIAVILGACSPSTGVLDLVLLCYIASLLVQHQIGPCHAVYQTGQAPLHGCQPPASMHGPQLQKPQTSGASR